MTRVTRILVAAAAVAMGTGCSPSTEPASAPASGPAATTPPIVIDRVVLVGDSLGAQIAPYLSTMVGSRTFAAQVFGGTAPCDWLGTDLSLTPTSVAVITFIGNSSTPCMAQAGGGFLHGEALVNKYRSDVTELIAQVRAIGAQVLLVGQPRRLGDATAEIESAGLDALYAGLAQPGAVSFVDAGAAVEDASGAFALRLPCMPGETQCDADGSIAVRSEDGVHFCSVSTQGGCAEYSSGAFRFAATLATAVNDE